jgi:REP element-mobilizing transposase RayT
MVAEVFEKTLTAFEGVGSSKYVVMPNHFHAIIEIDRADTRSAPTLMEIVQAFKSASTVAYIQLVKEGKVQPFEDRVWQRSFYDHVIRNQQDYLEIWRYIDENPLKWQLDRFYAEQ